MVVDGVASPRQTAHDGSRLPSPRLISNAVHSGATSADASTTYSHIQMLWGQFIDHDITLTPQTDPVSLEPSGVSHLSHNQSALVCNLRVY